MLWHSIRTLKSPLTTLEAMSVHFWIHSEHGTVPVGVAGAVAVVKVETAVEVLMVVGERVAGAEIGAERVGVSRA